MFLYSFAHHQHTLANSSDENNPVYLTESGSTSPGRRSNADVDAALRALNEIKTKQDEFQHEIEDLIRNEDEAKSRCRELETLVRELRSTRDELHKTSLDKDLTITALKW